MGRDIVPSIFALDKYTSVLKLPISTKNLVYIENY